MRFYLRPGLAFVLLATACICSAQEDDRFTDHGVAAEVTRSYGATATVDGDGRRVVLVWLSGVGDLLVIDAETGTTWQLQIPAPRGGNFAVLHSRRDMFYTHIGPWNRPGSLVEFNPRTMEFTFVGETAGTYAMAFHEDRDGLLWAALYPNAQLVSYNPDTRELVDHGCLNEENWPQYPRPGVARDEAGWVYTGIGFTRVQVMGYNPADGEVRRYIPEDERAQARDSDGWYGSGRVFLGRDGQVYATAPGWGWHRMLAGEATPLETDEPPVERAPDRAGTWSALFREFPDGSSIVGRPGLSVENRTLTMRDADGTERRVNFDYEAPGARIGNVVMGPDGALYGTTGGPWRVYRFDAETGEFTNHPRYSAGGHWNAWAVQRGELYGAFYPWGRLALFDVTQPWTEGVEEGIRPGESDPRYLYPHTDERVRSHLYRPHVLVAHPDGRHLVLGGTPDYGHTGGGLLIYDLDADEFTVLTHEDMHPHQSTMALVALRDGNLVGGTTVAPGTGGERLAQAAELYLFDWERRAVVWREALTGWAFVDLLLAPDGLVYALDTNATLLVFDPVAREVLHRESLAEYGRLAGGQAPRVMTLDPEGAICVLFQHAIVRLVPGSLEHRKLADSPVQISTGIALHEGRVWFSSGPRLWSYRLPGH